ncbi:MAG: ATP-dependent helicase [Lachnospiraceae bacterium]|nr:ATP-dependent helicase [Lachnospiraceae bacterium]
MELNRSQKLAVSFYEGAMLVLAGPGSGKTAVITNRVLSLIEERGVPLQDILVITFSRAAAGEMKTRFMRLSHGRYGTVNFGTFHAIFFKIIREALNYDISNIISEEDQKLYIKDSMKAAGISFPNERDAFEKICGYISFMKGAGGPSEAGFSCNPGTFECNDAETRELIKGKSRKEDVLTAEKQKEGSSCINTTRAPAFIKPEDMKRIFDGYMARLKSDEKIDFDDMMLLCLKVFRERPDLKAYWQGRFKFILVDEFQDINPLQYELVRILSKPEDNIFAVGDDDQSIYGFRGATPSLMFRFERDYRGCRRILLDTNYRSCDEILAGASKLIAVNKERFRKNVRTKKGQGGVFEHVHFDNFESETDYIIGQIKKHVAEGGRYSDIAVLYRMNSEIRPLHRRMAQLGIPVRLKEKTGCVFDHWIAADIAAYLELAAGNITRANLLRIANKPVRYLGRDSFINENVDLNELYEINRDKEYVIKNIDKLKEDLMFMSKLDVLACMKYIRYGVGYGKYLKKYAGERFLDEAEFDGVLGELEESARGHDSFASWKDFADEYREKLKMQEREAKEGLQFKEKEPDGVELMTFHRSKGLEFDIVYIIDVNEGYVPSKRAETPSEVEEERRAFFVAMTRARRELYLCEASDRLGRDATPSRFLKEMGV